MRLSDFNYNLPKNLIAQEPMKPRDHSRLLILDRQTGATEHKNFYDIVEYLKKGDVLVMNNSRVFSARLIGRRKESGGKVEVFLLRKTAPSPGPSPTSWDRGAIWQCLIGGRRIKEGLVVEFEQGLKGEVQKNNNDSTWEVEFNMAGKELMKIIEEIGQIPLPPYIKRIKNKESGINNDKKSYQTVYADENKIGSVAAPTAGFHFTPKLIQKLRDKGVEIEYVTLHVGLGTFAPVKTDDITKHKMHSEYVEVEQDVLKRIINAKKEKRRIIAVGTTSVRTLEAVSHVIASGAKQSREKRDEDGIATRPLDARNDKGFSGFVNIFIYPGYKFKIVDAMITNFHLPKSTLLMLVSAFACAEPSRSAGKENIDKTYKQAIKKKYRFYSYGDSMLIK